jgi:hypothetical protein
MKEPIEKQIASGADVESPFWGRGQTVGFACNTCNHELVLRPTPMPEDQRRLLRMKREHSILCAATGVLLILVSCLLLVWITDYGQPTNMWFVWMFMMLIGIMATTVGLESLVFGYKTNKERDEETA